MNLEFVLELELCLTLINKAEENYEIKKNYIRTSFDSLQPVCEARNTYKCSC